MLFDLRSAGRRRTVKFVYLALALLMFVGFVGFSIGSSGLNGGIVDAITGGSSTGNSADDASAKRLGVAVQTAAVKTKTTPQDAAAWAALAQARLRFSVVGENFDTEARGYTAAGKRQLTAAGDAYERYLALKPAKPDERLTRQMVQAYLANEKADKAVTAQELLTTLDPSQGTFATLAVYAYQAGNLRKGDLAATKAVELAPEAERKELKAQLDSAKSQSALSQIQEAMPTGTPASTATSAPTTEPTPTATLG